MRIAKVNYYSVPRKESGRCACCGQGIVNICHVVTVEGEHFTFGTTCFDKLIKDRLQTFQRKELNKSLKHIKSYAEQLKKWETMTETEYIENYYTKPWEEYDDVNTFDKYKEWMVNEFFPYRINEEQKVFKKFSKIDF